VRLDQRPVDRVFARIAEQRVDVRVAGVRGGAVEREVFPVADAGQQIEAEEVREGVHGVALALGVGVDRVRLGVRQVAQQALDDVDGLPDAAGDEVREQRDVVVGDVVVGDLAVAAVADVRLGKEVVDQRVDLRAVGRDARPVTPGLDQIELQVRVHDIRAREVELLGREVPGRGRAELVGGDAADVAGGLRRAEVRAVGERREHVAQ
jgi:hypothetical protein